MWHVGLNDLSHVAPQTAAVNHVSVITDHAEHYQSVRNQWIYSAFDFDFAVVAAAHLQVSVVTE
jgi:hypothetical protein